MIATALYMTSWRDLQILFSFTKKKKEGGADFCCSRGLVSYIKMSGLANFAVKGRTSWLSMCIFYTFKLPVLLCI